MQKQMNIFGFWVAILITLSTLSIFANETSRTNRQNTTPSVNTSGLSARENRTDQCPAGLVDWVEDDMKNSFLGGIITYSQISDLQKNCVEVMRSNQALIQSKLSQKKIDNSNDFTKALSEKYKGVAPTTATTLDQCNKLTGGKDEIVKARYFSSMAKMEAANSALIDEISYYDTLLDGEKKSNTLNCNPAFPFPEVSKKCTAYRSKNNTQACADSKKDRIEYLTTKTINALNKIEEERDALKKCMAEKGIVEVETPGVNPEFSTGPTRIYTNACKNIELAIAMTQSEVPWVKDKAFDLYAKRIQQLKKIGRTDTQIREVFKADMLEQIEKTRNEMAKAYDKNILMSECLTFSSSRGTAKCEVSDIKDHMASLPHINTNNAHSSRKIDLEISTRQDADQCISDAANIRRDLNKQVREDTFEYLSYFSMALGPIGYAIKGAGMLGGISTAMKGKRVQAITKALMSSTAGIAIGTGVFESLEACQKAGEVSIAESEKKHSVRAPACAAVPSLELESTTSEYNECVKSALLTTADLLPFTIGLLRGSNKDILNLFKDPKQRAEVEKILARNGRMTDAERKVAAEDLLGRKLSKVEQECIIAAHNIAGEKTMKIDQSSTNSNKLESADLKAKNRHLISVCNLSTTDAFLLTRSGITGNSEFEKMAFEKLHRAALNLKPGSEESIAALKKAEDFIRQRPREARLRAMIDDGVLDPITRRSSSGAYERIASGHFNDTIDDMIESSIRISNRTDINYVGNSRIGKSVADLLDEEDKNLKQMFDSAFKDSKRATDSTVAAQFEMEAWNIARAREELIQRRLSLAEDGVLTENTNELTERLMTVGLDLNTVQAGNKFNYFQQIRKYYDNAGGSGDRTATTADFSPNGARRVKPGTNKPPPVSGTVKVEPAGRPRGGR